MPAASAKLTMPVNDPWHTTMYLANVMYGSKNPLMARKQNNFLNATVFATCCALSRFLISDVQMTNISLHVIRRCNAIHGHCKWTRG